MERDFESSCNNPKSLIRDHYWVCVRLWMVWKQKLDGKKFRSKEKLLNYGGKITNGKDILNPNYQCYVTIHGKNMWRKFLCMQMLNGDMMENLENCEKIRIYVQKQFKFRIN